MFYYLFLMFFWLVVLHVANKALIDRLVLICEVITMTYFGKILHFTVGGDSVLAAVQRGGFRLGTVQMKVK